MTQSTSRALHPMPGLAWTDLRDDAAAFAGHGWPVLPGTYQLAASGVWLGKPRSTKLEPIADVWTMAATTDPTVAAQWWAERPYSLLLACGILVDAFEVPQQLGGSILDYLRMTSLPVAVTPRGSMLVFARTSPVNTDQVPPAEIRWHSMGSWVALPPTVCAGVPYRWKQDPHSLGWRLPEATRLHRALEDHRAGGQ